MPSPHTNDPLHSDIPEEPAPMPTSDADAYARGREDERVAILQYLDRFGLEVSMVTSATDGRVYHTPVLTTIRSAMAFIKDGGHVR